MSNYIAYYRVSTQQQGRSGLGLEAQQHTARNYVQSIGGKLCGEYTDIQSGKDNNRPQLIEALRMCTLSNSVLVIAKLDRLSRNAAFLLTLQQSGARFVACDMPEANEGIIGIMAVIAQMEGRAISDRTKAALAAAKRRGTKLGSPANLPQGDATTAKRANEAMAAKAKLRALSLLPVIDQARNLGFESLDAIAGYLNDIGVTTRRGSRWNASNLCRLLKFANR